MKLLVVCAGNLGRSQAVEHYLVELARETGVPVEVRSAGISIGAIKDLQKRDENVWPGTDAAIKALDTVKKGGRKREKGGHPGQMLIPLRCPG